MTASLVAEIEFYITLAERTEYRAGAGAGTSRVVNRRMAGAAYTSAAIVLSQRGSHLLAAECYMNAAYQAVAPVMKRMRALHAARASLAITDIDILNTAVKYYLENCRANATDDIAAIITVIEGSNACHLDPAFNETYQNALRMARIAAAPVPTNIDLLPIATAIRNRHQSVSMSVPTSVSTNTNSSPVVATRRTRRRRAEGQPGKHVNSPTTMPAARHTNSPC